MPQRPQLNSEEFESWLLHPGTKALKFVLDAWVAEAKERWASGAFTDQSQYVTAIANAKAIGNCEVCERIKTLDFEAIEQELDDGSKE
jgi:hypothetical protein